MSHIEIVNTFEQDCFFIVEVECFDDIGNFVYSEHYRWLGSEGLVQKKEVNALGETLLDDGTVAPQNFVGTVREQAYLPEGRTWKRRPGPHMDDSSIWETILTDYKRRQELGFLATRNVLTRQILQQDVADRFLSGIPPLLERFKSIVGDVVVP